MKPPGCLYFILLIFLSITLNLVIFSDLFSQTGMEYLAAAEKTANWLIALTEEQYDGFCWPESDINSLKTPGLCNGAAGTGLFFLKLYKVTGNTFYLNVAEKAGKYIYYEHTGVNMYGPDSFFGAASGGNYFLDLFKEAGKDEYLEKAKYFAGWLIDNKYTEGGGYFWKHSPDYQKIYPGIAHGTAGIGLFFLKIYEQTLDTQYLEYAEKAFLWMTNHIIRFDENSIGWKRLNTDDFAYHLWCGGSTGIIFFLKKLYETTGKSSYENYLRETVNGLMKYAVYSNDGCSWFYTSDQSGGFSTIYCHGTSSTALALFSANAILNQEDCLNCARSGAKWLEHLKKYKSSCSIYWTYFSNSTLVNTGFLTGVASIGYSFVEYYKFDPYIKYLDLARLAANWILEVADSPTENQIRWVNYTSATNSSSEKKQYYTGWYHGASGIGIFLLELYEVINQVDTKYLEDKIPVKFCMIRNYPNPFNNHTKIEIILPEITTASLEIFDLSGKKVKTLSEQKSLQPGIHSFFWYAWNDFNISCSSGVYIVRFQTESNVVSCKAVYLK